MLAVDGIDPEELSKALGIPIRQERGVEAVPAPSSWPIEKRSVTHRELAANLVMASRIVQDGSRAGGVFGPTRAVSPGTR